MKFQKNILIILAFSITSSIALAAPSCVDIFKSTESKDIAILEVDFFDSQIFDPIVSTFNTRYERDMSSDPNIRHSINRQLILSIIQNHHKEPAMLKAEMTPTEALTILHYTRSGHEFINRASANPEQVHLVLPFNRILNSALDKLPSYIGTVRRNISLSPESISSFSTGQIIEQPTFTSTTTNLNSKLFSNQVRLIIHSKSGKDISDFSPYPEEREVLFKTHTKFKVISILEEIPHDRAGSTYRIELAEI